MSTPGSLIIPAKGTNQLVPSTGPVDGGTLLRLVDPLQGIDTDRLFVPCQDTRFSLQFQAVFSSTTKDRPTWVQAELVRCRKVGPTWQYDSTGKSRPGIVQPGTTTWPFVFTADEFVDGVDGAYGWTITHNGLAAVRVEVDIFRAINEKANHIYRLGGYNVMSDGSIGTAAWVTP